MTLLEITLNLENENINFEIALNDGGVLSGLHILREYQDLNLLSW